MIWRNVLLAGFLLLLLTGCGSKNGEEKSTEASLAQPDKATVRPQLDTVSTEKVFVYECGDSLTATAYVSADSTWLFLPDTTLKMPELKSASGVKYKTDNYLYWTKGNEALLQLPKGSLMSCRLQPKKQPWATAKLRDVDFRAVGQEPGWILEITEGEQIKYVANYGQDTLYTSAPEPIREDGKIIYDVNKDKHHLRVTIEDKSCTDSMNGARFAQTVHIQADNKEHKGCGKILTN